MLLLLLHFSKVDAVSMRCMLCDSSDEGVWMVETPCFRVCRESNTHTVKWSLTLLFLLCCRMKP